MAEVPQDAGEQPQIKSIFPQSQQEMQTPQKVTKSLFDQRVWIIVVVVCSIFLLLSVDFYQKKTSQQYSAALQNRPTITPTQRPYPTPPSAKRWVLKKITGTEELALFSVCGEAYCFGGEIAQWGDWLFYKAYEGQNILIKSFNLITGASAVVYDVAQNASDFGNQDRQLPTELSDLQVIGDTLYFSLGGYLTRGGIFWVPLPHTSKPQKLTDSRNANITFWKDRYWVIGGEGDACWGIIDFSFLDTTQKQITHIATSTVGCYDGEEYIAIDKRDRMLMAYHNNSNGTNKENINVYLYVIAIPINTPSSKEGVIAKQDMPPEVSEVYYLSDTDQLALVGKEKYLYDFSSKTIQKVDVLPQKPPADKPQLNHTVTDSINALHIPSEYKLVLE